MWELDNKKRLSTEELMPLNCGAGENSCKSLGLWGDPTKSIQKEINLEYSLEGLMLKLKLKLQYFDHLMRRTDSLEKTLMQAGGEEDKRGWDGWMASPTQWTWVWANSGVGDGQGSLVCCSPWGCKELDTTERLNKNSSRMYVFLKLTWIIYWPGQAIFWAITHTSTNLKEQIPYKVCSQITMELNW